MHKRKRGTDAGLDGGQKRGGGACRVKEMDRLGIDGTGETGDGEMLDDQEKDAECSPPGTGRGGACREDGVLPAGRPAEQPCASDDVQIVEVDAAATVQQPEQRGYQAGGSDRADLTVRIKAETDGLHQHVRQMQPLFPSATCPADGILIKSQACIQPPVLDVWVFAWTMETHKKMVLGRCLDIEQTRCSCRWHLTWRGAPFPC